MVTVTQTATRTACKPAHVHLGALIKDIQSVMHTAWAARSLSSNSGATKYGAPLFERLSHLSACALEMSSFRT